MAEVLINRDTNKLEISSYNGYSGETFRYSATSERPPNELNFFREGNNHSYVGGEITYKRGCENNLVVSPYKINFLKDIKNAFIFVEDSFVEISPIYDLEGIIGRLRYHLFGNKINYNIPSSVLNRENLGEKDRGNLERVLRESYEIVPKEIAPIPSRSKDRGIFYLMDERGKKYVFKFKNKKEGHAEILSEITKLIPDFFPRSYQRKDAQRYTVDMDDGWYGLESFVEGMTKERDLEYFSLVGKNIGKLHQQFEQLVEKIAQYGYQWHFTSNGQEIKTYLSLMKETASLNER